ncbi:hypothetical protein N8344_00455 [bacterium]|nr:hypothetical protein [bacterium]
MENEELDDLIKTYIYESPDSGVTVTRREFGENDKEVSTPDGWVDTSDYYSDYYIDTKDSTIDLSGILTHGITNSGAIHVNSNTITTDAFEDFNDISLDVNGKIRKVSELFTSVDAIEKRLGILHPDPKLLEKYEVLQGLYEQYKAAEAMLYEDDAEEE